MSEEKPKKPKGARMEKVAAYVSPYLYGEIMRLVEEGYFATVSDVTNTALLEFVTKFKAEKPLKYHTEVKKGK
jgi:Arc/MetJ-type ribon-helix-helix transcriptional regulator